MKKLFFILMLLLVTLMSFATVNILSPVGPTTVSLVGMLENKVEQGVETNITFWKNFDQITSGLVSKTADIIILPVSTGAKLYTKGMEIQLSAVTLWKTFYMVTKNFSSTSIADYEGVDVYTPMGKGQTGDVMARFIFIKSGLKPDENVFMKYASPPEILALMAQGKVKAAVMPEPYVTLMLKKAKGTIAFDMQEKWGEFTGYNRIPITGAFVRKAALEEKPEEIAEALKALRKSVIYSKENPAEAVKLTTKYLKAVPEAVLIESLGRSDYNYESSQECKVEVLDYLQNVHDVDPKAMPSVPSDEFFQK